jgi:ribosomal protein S18 acetylase RimI-like enzyme
MLTLKHKSQESLEAWLPGMWADYLQHRLDAGSSLEESQQNVERLQKILFHENTPAPGQHVMDVFDGDSIVGTLWLSQQQEGTSSEWFVYDVVVDEPFRGRGYGRSTMQAAETFVEERGGTRLGLNVFGNNVVARSLYESMDYMTVSINMAKELL